MGTTAGIVSGSIGTSTDEQRRSIRSVCGDILIINTTFLIIPEIKKEIGRLKRAGVTRIVVTKISCLDKNLTCLGRILRNIHSRGMQLSVIRDGELVQVEISHQRGERMFGVSISGIDWLTEMSLPVPNPQ